MTSLLGTTTNCHSSACIYVDLKLICFTVHFISEITTKSPIEKGLSRNIENEAKTSCKIFCRAKATATHPIHKLANKGVISIPKFIKISKTAVIRMMTFIVSLTTFFVISKDFSSFPLLNFVISAIKKVLKTLLAQKTINTINADTIKDQSWLGKTIN